MNIIKKSNESVVLTVTTDVDLTGRSNSARLIIKTLKTDSDASAVYDDEETVNNPAAFSVTFTVPPSVTHDLSGKYYYEVWTYVTDKSDALLCDEGTMTFHDPILNDL